MNSQFTYEIELQPYDGKWRFSINGTTFGVITHARLNGFVMVRGRGLWCRCYSYEINGDEIVAW